MPELKSVHDEHTDVFTLDDANALNWRTLDVQALESRVEAVWAAVESMQEAQTVTRNRGGQMPEEIVSICPL
jgi:hypothetical protein